MINIIACISSNNALGYRQELLFEIKNDLRNFQNKTKNQLVVMGRKTFESIIDRNGKPLPNRTNVVLTKNNEYTSQYGEIVFNSVEQIINHHKTMGDKDKKVFVIGGEEIFKEFIPYTDNIYLTEVNKYVHEVDTFYPMELQESLNFIPIHEEEHFDEDSNLAYKFVTYRKKEDVIGQSED